MIISLATYHQRLAAVFESAEYLSLFRLQDEAPVPLGQLCFRPENIAETVALLSAHNVEHLICGAMCGCDKEQFTQANIAVTPWICGDINTVLEAFRNETITKLRMPGCRRHPPPDT